MFSGLVNENKNRWTVFLYEDDDTCIGHWTKDERNENPKWYSSNPRRDISIQKRIYIFSTDQNGQLKHYPVPWEHRELTEDEACLLLLDFV